MPSLPQRQTSKATTEPSSTIVDMTGMYWNDSDKVEKIPKVFLKNPGTGAKGKSKQYMGISKSEIEADCPIKQL